MEGEMKQKRSADDAERVKFLKTTFEGELKNAGSKKVGSLLKDCLQVWASQISVQGHLCVCVVPCGHSPCSVYNLHVVEWRNGEEERRDND